MPKREKLGTVPWADCIPEDKWPVYKRIIDAARQRGLRFALGGAFAVATHTGRWRDTKDIDFYVLPAERKMMIDVLNDSGLKDYHDQLPYDRSWIYRGYNEDVIADVIWAMPNRRAQVTEEWLDRSSEVIVHGDPLRMVTAEHMLWGKLYVLQRDRCDWSDMMNMVYYAGERLDWEHLLELVGEDDRLLGAMMAVFSWIVPNTAAVFPDWMWKRLEIRPPKPVDKPEEVMLVRAKLLDTRPWFIPAVEAEEDNSSS